MRVLVCGGRHYQNKERVWTTLDGLNHPAGSIEVLITGGARGADNLAEGWARNRGDVCILVYPVTEEDWRRGGLAAGPMRNQRMLDESEPELVVAFAGGSGTADMVRRARCRGVPIVYPDGIRRGRRGREEPHHD